MRDEESLQAAIHEAVELEPYHFDWPVQFELERARLLSLLPDAFVDVEHFGSTAVRGMIAEPIFEVLAGVASLEGVDELTRVCSIGYTTSAAFNHRSKAVG